jgi:diguanylate cyclase (GGDEF)-like protein
MALDHAGRPAREGIGKTQLHAPTDPLTGLANRRTLEGELCEMMRAGTRFSLAFGDLDHFKKLNDNFGHEMGDRALRLFAKVLRAGTRDGDILARYGGEEFVLVFPERTIAEASDALNRLRMALLDGVSTSDVAPFTSSFGVTDSSVGTTIDEIIRHADAALLDAKEAGRDKVSVSDMMKSNR